MQRPELQARTSAIRVSILTRPVGRMQPDQPEGGRKILEVSILTRPVGRMQPDQPEGGRKILEVSILTRPVGRMQREVYDLRALHIEFQSSPGP